MVVIQNNSPQLLEFVRPTWGYAAYLVVPPFSGVSYTDEEFEPELLRQLTHYYAGSSRVTWS
jgi:hypothetical protein